MLVCCNIDDDFGCLIKSLFSRFLYCQDTGFSFEVIKYQKVKVLVPQWCLTLCDPVDCSPPGSSVLGILQARILEWVAIPFSRGSSQPRDRTQVSPIEGGFLPAEPQGKPKNTGVGSLSFLQQIFPTQELAGASCFAGRFFTN